MITRHHFFENYYWNIKAKEESRVAIELHLPVFECDHLPYERGEHSIDASLNVTDEEIHCMFRMTVGELLHSFTIYPDGTAIAHSPTAERVLVTIAQWGKTLSPEAKILKSYVASEKRRKGLL